MEQSLEFLGVGITSPYLTSLLRDQTQPGLFSGKKEEAGNKVWSPLGVRRTSPYLTSLLRDQTQQGVILP